MQLDVLLDQLLFALFHGAGQLHGLADQGAQHGQKADVLVEAVAVGEDAVDREDAQDLALDGHGQAEEGHVALGQGRARQRAIQEKGVLADVGHHHGLAGGQDLAGDALADLVTAALDLGLGQAVGRPDGETVPVGRAQDQRAPVEPEHFMQDLEGFLGGLFDVQAAAQGLGHFVEGRNFRNLAV